MKRTKNFLMMILLVVGLGYSLQANAQESFDQMYEEILNDFISPEVRKDIESLREEALKDDSSKKPGYSFFRDDPTFQKLMQKEIQRRRKDPVEKQHRRSLSIYQPLSKKVSASVFALYGINGADRLAYATAVANGYLVTKAGELGDRRSFKCVAASGESFTAKLVEINTTHDLAILKTETKLNAVDATREAYQEGSLLVTVGNNSYPLAMGTLAVKPRSIIGKNRGFLGVEPRPGSRGVNINSVTPGSAAFRAGVKAGDIVTAINEINTRSVADLVREIGSKKRGQTINLSINRSGKMISIDATLDGRNQNGERANRFEIMRRLGAVISRRSDEFPSVIEHDTPIMPNECGSPLVDLDGNVVGINIARAGRTNSYALPIDLVDGLVDKAAANSSN